MGEMIAQYEAELNAIDDRIKELKEMLSNDLQSMEKAGIQRRLLFLEESRCNLIYGIKSMRRGRNGH